MLATLGPHRFDVTHDAVLVAAVSAVGPRPHAVMEGWTGPPDAVLVLADGETADVAGAAVAAWCAATVTPLIVRTPRAEVAAAALAAGASAAHDPSGLSDQGYLAAVVAAGASLVVGCPAEDRVDAEARTARLVGLAAQARAAGLGPGRVVLDVTPGETAAPEAVRFLAEVPLAAAAGWPVMVVVAAPSAGPDADLAVAAAHAVVLPRGARFLPTDDVRTTRRVAHVVAELLRARDGGHG